MSDVQHLSTFLRRPIVGRDGDRIGRVQDLVARLGDDVHPPLVGAVIRIEGRDLFVPARKLTGWEDGALQLTGRRVDLRKFERRPGELLVAGDLLAHNLINLVRGRLVRAHDIELAQVGGVWAVVGVNPRRAGHHGGATTVIDFAAIQPFVSHVPTARLRIPYRKLARLHPALIADLVEQASHEEGEEIIEAVGQDRELEADVFEELDTTHQLEFIEDRTDADAARLLARMEPDSAADLITEIDQDRRRAILEGLPEAQQRKVRNLLAYNADTAGGLMSPDYAAVPETCTVGDALEAVRTAAAPVEALQTVFLLDASGQPVAAAPVAALVRARAGDLAREIATSPLAHVHPQWDLAQVARKMSDFNLTVMPVVDESHHGMLGVITVDDLLEELLPQGWRREFGPTAVEE